MNTRESLAESELRFNLERALEKLIRDHPGLRQFHNRRHEENIREKIEDNTSFEEALKKIMQRSPTLAALFLTGQRISDPFKTKGSGTETEYNGKEFPTYFRFKGLRIGQILKRRAEHGRTARIRFETDAENSYFGRPKEPGTFSLICRDSSGVSIPLRDYSLNPFNGIATLNVELPAKFEVGTIANIQLEVSDSNRLEPFVNEAHIEIVPFVQREAGPTRSRTKPPSHETGGDHLTPSGLAMPNTYWVSEDAWEEHEFSKESALQAQRRPTDDSKIQAYDFFINADNIYLLRELKQGNVEIVKEQFRIGMALVALAVIHSCKEEDDGETIQDKVKFSCDAVAMMLIPLMNALNALDAKDIASE